MIIIDVFLERARMHLSIDGCFAPFTRTFKVFDVVHFTLPWLKFIVRRISFASKILVESDRIRTYLSCEATATVDNQ